MFCRCPLQPVWHVVFALSNKSLQQKAKGAFWLFFAQNAPVPLMQRDLF
jgi:galactose mutarotase-like enzyme